MRAIFQEKGKKVFNKGKVFGNLDKMYKIWKYFEKGRAIIARNKLLEKALVGKNSFWGCWKGYGLVFWIIKVIKFTLLHSKTIDKKDKSASFSLFLWNGGKVCLPKGCVRYIFACLFLGLNESTCQMKKNVSYFISKPLFVLEKIKF